MPLEGDVSVVLVVEVLLLAASSEAPHHGDEPGRLGTLMRVRGLARVPPTHRLQQSSKETTCWVDYTSICSESERERRESPSLVQMHTQTIHRPVKEKCT